MADNLKRMIAQPVEEDQPRHTTLDQHLHNRHNLFAGWGPKL